MIREQVLSVGEVSLQVACGPKHGPPLVLLHGVSRRWQDFGPVLPALSLRWQIFALDHRGHGKSNRAGRYLVADYLEDALHFVAGLEQPPAVIGHSLGALTALGVASRTPVRGIVLADPPSAAFLQKIEQTSYGPLFRAMQRFAGQPRSPASIAQELGEVELPDGRRVSQVRDALALRFLARGLLDLDPNVLTPVIEKRWLEGIDLVEFARRVTCPALVLVGETSLGGMLPSGDADALVAALPDAVRIDTVGVGHHLHAVRPEQFLQLATNFFDSL